MNKDLRKRLEEAAEEQLNCDSCLARKYGECKEHLKCLPYRSFLAGAEHGYKEAIALAKEWIEKWIGKNKQPVLASETGDTIVGYSIDIDRAVADFEADLSKLLEKKK